MSIHQDKRSGKWLVRWREGDRQRSKGGLSKADARLLDQEIRRDLLLGRPVLFRRDVPTLREYATQWLLDNRDVSTSTTEFRTTLLGKHVFPSIGHLSLIDLTPRRLTEWQREARRRGSDYMAQRATQLLGQVLDEAVREELLFANPARSLRHISHANREGVALSPAEVESLRRWFLRRKRFGDAVLVSVLAYIGLRPEEALGMQWANLHERYFVEHKNVDAELVPAPKTGHRWVEVPGLVRRELEEWRKSQDRLGGLVFPTPRGDAWSKSDRGNWRRRHFKKAAADIGREGLRPYDLRHSAVSMAAACGWTGPEMTEQFGHRPDTSARIYQHLIADLRGKRPESFDELIAQARGRERRGLRAVD